MTTMADCATGSMSIVMSRWMIERGITMNYRQMGERVYIRIDKGEEILAQMVDVCRQLHISA